MEQGNVFLQMLQKRIELLSHLKGLLLQQQRALVEGDTDRITSFSELQIECMEEIQTLEMAWRKMVQEIKTGHDAAMTTEQAVSLILEDSEIDQFLALGSQVKSLVSEINMIKKNNTMLINNSLTLVRSTMRYLRGEKPTDSFYHPNRKAAAGHIVLNRKL